MVVMQASPHFELIEESHRPRGPIDFSILTDINLVASIAVEWDDLLAKSRVNRAYGSSKWYLATVELKPGLQPLVFTARRNGTLSGLLPLWLDVNEKLATIGDDSFTEHSDIIAEDGDYEVITGLLDFALKGAANYDRLFLGDVKRDSNYIRAAEALGLGETVNGFFQPDKVMPYAVVDLTSGYDHYMKTLSRKFRLNLHRLCHKAARDGFVIGELTPTDLNPALLPEMLLSLHLSRFGNRSSIKSSQAWIRTLFPSLFAQGRLRIFAMLDHDRVVAMDSATVTRSGMYGFVGGFLSEVQKYDPGKLLIHKAIQQACLDGLTEFDLGWWRQDYKAHWKPIGREVGCIQFATYLWAIDY